MMFITEIKTQANKKRVNIFLDGEFNFSLGLETLLRNNLKKGQSLNNIQVQKLITDDDFIKWYNRVLNYSAIRPHSRKEISDNLKKAGIGEMTLKLVLQKLAENKLVDDVKFANWFVEQRLTFKPKSRYLLTQELRQRGVAADIIKVVLENLVNPDLEKDQAIKIIHQRQTRWQKLSPLEIKKKAQSLLVRRGYSWETITNALAKISPQQH